MKKERLFPQLSIDWDIAQVSTLNIQAKTQNLPNHFSPKALNGKCATVLSDGTLCLKEAKIQNWRGTGYGICSYHMPSDESETSETGQVDSQ